jgi:fido (protein-threonine AMPylation protein)
VLEWVKSEKALTMDILLEWRAELMQGAKTFSGDFESQFCKSTEPIMAGNYTFPPDAPLEGMKGKMAAVLKEQEEEFSTCHPIEGACSLLLNICSRHPFLNGNGC